MKEEAPGERNQLYLFLGTLEPVAPVQDPLLVLILGRVQIMNWSHAIIVQPTTIIRMVPLIVGP